MRPLVVSVVVASAMAAAALGVRNGPRPLPSGASAGKAAAGPLSAPCPEGTLPDDGVCIPVPGTVRPDRGGEPERIPRRPDRPADYALYGLPLPAPPRDSGARISQATEAFWTVTLDGGAVPPRTGLALPTPAGAEVRSVTLEGQEGPARILYVGALVGPTVVTVHEIRDHDRPKTYLVVLGQVRAAVRPTLASRTELAPGAVVGTAATAAVYVDVRSVRPDVDVFSLPPAELMSDARSVSTDPRNVLRLLSQAAPAR